MRAALFLCPVLGALALGFADARAEPVPDAPPLVPRDLAPLRQETHALVQAASGQPGAVATLRGAGGELVSGRLRIWRVPSGAAARIVPRLAVGGLIEDFEPDRRRVPLEHRDAGDPLLPQQWWLARIGADRVEPPGAGVPITVIDAGVDLTHPEFAARPDTVALNQQTIVGRGDFHGTAVASVAAAPANGIGIVGVYPRASLRVWDASPGGGSITTQDVIRGIAAAPCRGVISLSLGGAFRSRLEARAVVDAYARGCVVVAASGNEREFGNAPNFPASLPHVLTVGATDAADVVASFSSSSPGMDLVAPGIDIPVAATTAFDPTGFVTESGTSFSTPMVAGAAAWVWTARPQLEKTQLFELMRRSARDLPPAGRNRDSGFGLLDIPNALTMPAPPVDPFEPNDEIDHVRPGGLFAAGRAPLTSPVRARAVVNARLDAVDDPRDVYRVWVPRGQRVIVTLAGPPAVELRYAGPTAIRRTSRLGPRRLEIVNRTATGAFVYVSAFIRARAEVPTAAYRIGITTARAPALARR